MGMPSPATLIGAGIGAVGSAVTGNNPLKGALLGAGLGSGYGGIQSLLNGGSFMSGAFPFMAETAAPSQGLSLIAQGGGATMPAYTAPIGMANSFNLATGVPIATEAASSVAPAMLSTLPSAGGLTAASTAVPYMQQLGYTLDEIKSMLPEMTSQNVGNVIGGASVAQKYMQRPQIQPAPSGGVSRGNPPSSSAVQELIRTITPQPKKRISLLVG